MSDMKTNSLAELEKMLKEEKWTRANVADFSMSNLEELIELLNTIIKNEQEEEAQELCEDFLQNNKTSIMALYISGIIALRKQRVDDVNILALINLFIKNKRWKIAATICKIILEYDENIFALRILSECYENEGSEEEKYQIWERLVRIDYNESELVRLIAENKERNGQVDEAISFYQKAIYRYLNTSNLNKVLDIWKKLISLAPDHLEFYQQIYKQALRIDEEVAIEMLELLYPIYQATENWERAITVIKWILEIESDHGRIRKELVNTYKELYKDHSQIDAYIKFSNLTQNWRNVLEAIADFEKHISFDAGNFVYHNSWGIGCIKGISGNDITIDFVKKRNHTMDLQMAIDALLSIPKDHIWVLKSVIAKEKLHNRVKKDIPWTLKTIIRSFANKADMKKVKAELVPHVLGENEWTSWSQEARKILKSDSSFGVHGEKASVFLVRDIPITKEQKLFDSFKSEYDFFKKLQIAEEYLQIGTADSDYYIEMFQYFANSLKSQIINEQVITAFLYVKQISANHSFLKIPVNLSFKDLYEQIGRRPGETITNINNISIKKIFILNIKNEIENWQNIFVDIFPYYPNDLIIDLLQAENDFIHLKEIVDNAFQHFRDLRLQFFWLAQNAFDKPWFLQLNIAEEKVWITTIRFLDISYRNLANKYEIPENRKINRGINNLLFKEKQLEKFLLNCDPVSIQRIFFLLLDIKDLDQGVLRDLRERLNSEFPDLNLKGESSGSSTPVLLSSSSHHTLVTSAKLEEKKSELKNILEVEIPKNSKEIGIAIELGDLSENAEYKAGKEKQENLNIAVGKLKDEIERSKVFDPSDIDTTKVSFGTVVTLENATNNEEETYTILGPWESDPENGILSYLSPFSLELLGSKEGDKLNFTINTRKSEYEVKSLVAAKF